MIRKWSKFHTSFIDLLKIAATNKTFDQKWLLDNPFKLHRTCSSLNSLHRSQSFSSFIKFVKPISDPKERGDGERFEALDVPERFIVETPANTNLFEIKGPNGSAFLVEVNAKDLEEIKNELTRLKGDHFQFDKAIVDWFNIKCLLSAEPIVRAKDQKRLVKIHAISSGCEEVHELDGSGQYLFVNSLDRTMRAKRILEKLGYKICGILYRFQPKQKVKLEDHLLKICNNFVKAVERLPKVISVTHNL